MTWPLLLLAVFVGIGMRPQWSERKLHVVAFVVAASVVGIVYLGLSKAA